MTPASVELRGFGYRPPNRSQWALRDLDLSVEAGERVLLLGSSGSGKSTILRALAGLLDAGGEQAGIAAVDGVAAARARDRVGLLLQDPDAQLVLSRAGEDVAFGPQNRGYQPDEVARRVAEALESVGFPYSVDRPVGALSGGERQRLALAGVLALTPGVLLLDEPTSLLDPAGSELVRNAVSRAVIETGATVIVVEHQAEQWLPIVDRVVVVSNGKVAVQGSPAVVREHPAARDTWLVPPLIQRPPGLLSQDARAPLLTASDVSFRYRNSAVDSLTDIQLSLQASAAVSVTGPNGSGKTTLARLLGGLVAPTTGAVTASSALTGSTLTQPNPHRWRARELAGRIGSVFQNPEHAFLAHNVRQELAIGPRALGRSERQVTEIVDGLLTRLHLEQVVDANPFTLSGGEQRRLSVAAALATSPHILILDEPTFGQDPVTWRELVKLVAGLRDQAAAIVVVTHDAAFRDQVSDHELRLTSSGRMATA
ncbi:MAG TPA: ATP-binding cassette domain-containing protein [Actinomycetes bacterium]|nr:ATP-binding cassette domain-containing protein [Actinomycetes bacterium]